MRNKNILGPKRYQGVQKNRAPPRGKPQTTTNSSNKGDPWTPKAKLSVGISHTLELHRYQDPGAVATREEPWIYWTSKPRSYDWKRKLKLSPDQMNECEKRHEDLAKQECLRWGWKYVIIRKELHSTTGKGRYRRPCDPHITVYLSMEPEHHQVEGHWFCEPDKQEPWCPDGLVPDGAVYRPLGVPPRELFLMGSPPFNQSLPDEWQVPLPVPASSSPSTAASPTPAASPSPTPSTTTSSVPTTPSSPVPVSPSPSASVPATPSSPAPVSPSPSASVPATPSSPVPVSPSPRTSVPATPNPSGVKRKRSSEEVDPADPATSAPEVNDAEKRVKRRIDETDDQTSQGQVGSQSPQRSGAARTPSSPTRRAVASTP